jgi:hypothetical protein
LTHKLMPDENLAELELVYVMEAFDRGSSKKDGQWDTSIDLTLLAKNLGDRFGKVYSESVLENWKSKWQTRVRIAGRAESTVHWLSPGILKEEGIEMELYGQLREVERELRIAFPSEIFVGVTIRRLRWWQMMLLARDFPGNWLDVIYIAERFLTRQLVAQYTETALDYDDLRAHLSYAPWRGGKYENAYLGAIDSGSIVPLRLPISNQSAWSAAWDTTTVAPTSLLMEFGSQWLGAKPWQLLSQAFSKNAAAGNGQVSWSFGRGEGRPQLNLDWEPPVL